MDRHDTNNAHGMARSHDRSARALQLAAAQARASYMISIYQGRRPGAAEPATPRRGRQLSWKLWLLFVILVANWVLV